MGLSFHELDVDDNGLITPPETEISSALIEQFAKLDCDKSDTSSPREFARFKQ
ncbi:calmodulin [Pseudoalteromonas byunsanensis]|nr:calmodulin [Pseudoalteromonas byunsanensis]